MSQPVLEAQNVGKMYRMYRRPVDRLLQILRGGDHGRSFWALRDVSFSLSPGEALGIIGRNGSGKSTLLQLLAGVLQPTEGSVTTAGRIAALLELGSGFNPEYSGRDNVYMNGAILGLSRAQMDQRYDRIADFAEIGDFIEQPVKTYSSGMFVRLAFAVATHVDAEVLLVDEALAVGDVFFRQKCYRHLTAMRQRGLSVILVTHSMADVEQFCQRAILLHKGQAVFAGPSSEAVKHYYLVEQSERASIGTASKPAPDETAKPPSFEASLPRPSPSAMIDLSDASQISDAGARCVGLALCNLGGEPCRVFEQTQRMVVWTEWQLAREIEVPVGGVTLRDEKGLTVHGKNTLQLPVDPPRRVAAGQTVRFAQEIELSLRSGEYTLEVGLAALSAEDFDRRGIYPHVELHARTHRLCHLPGVVAFSVIPRKLPLPPGTLTQLPHYGAADLPGAARIAVE